jgi:hypothetical protein
LYTFGNGDAYDVSWTYSAEYNSNGTELSVDPTVTYVGSSPSVGDDSLEFQYFQNFYDAGPWNGTYTEIIPLYLSANAAGGSTVSGQLFYDGQGIGLIGPYPPGNYSGMNSANLSGLTDPTLSADFQFYFDFAEGSTNGASASAASSSAPEPAQTWPTAIFLLVGVYYRFVWRRRST